MQSLWGCGMHVWLGGGGQAQLPCTCHRAQHAGLRAHLGCSHSAALTHSVPHSRTPKWAAAPALMWGPPCCCGWPPLLPSIPRPRPLGRCLAAPL